MNYSHLWLHHSDLPRVVWPSTDVGRADVGRPISSGDRRYPAVMAPFTADDEILTREQFVAYVHELRAELLAYPERWHNVTLETFLDALGKWSNDAPSWYRNVAEDLPPSGDWTFFARALAAATVYE